MGLEGLPAEGSEPGQVIGVVDIVANSDNLMETLNLNTHHLQDKRIQILANSPVLAIFGTRNPHSGHGRLRKTITFKNASPTRTLLSSLSLPHLAMQSFMSHRVDVINTNP